MVALVPQPAVVLYHADFAATHQVSSSRGFRDLQHCIGECVELPCNTSYTWQGLTYAICGEG